MTTTIYILRLTGNNWYVGKTDNFQKRMEEHVRGEGSAWTRLHKVLKVDKVIEGANPFEEDRYVKEYMSKYGIEKVRGGSYVEVKLSEFHQEALKMEIWGAKDLCTQCGRSGHFVKNCYATSDVFGKPIEYEEDEDDEEWVCEYCDKPFQTEYAASLHEKTCSEAKTKSFCFVCYRCGRSGHYASNCYASKHIDGNYI
jgi:predicted GIY-YIG superfamily endonuclease